MRWRGPDLAIVGTGPTGSALARLLSRVGATVKAVGGRNMERTRRAAEPVHAEAVLGAAEAAARAPWVLLAVPDDVVHQVGEEIAGAWQSGLPPRAAVVHVSGVLGTASLAAVKAVGAGTGVAHPLQSVVDVEGGMLWLPRSTFGISGSGEGLTMARAIAQAVTGQTDRPPGRIREIDDEQRPLYHAAACMASNYLAVLAEVASGLMAEGLGGGDGEALAALLPLIEGTLSNVGQRGARAALTGPVARGDAGTVRSHLEAMTRRQVPASWGGIYRTLGREALAMARARGLPESLAVPVAEALAAPPDEEELRELPPR